MEGRLGVSIIQDDEIIIVVYDDAGRKGLRIRDVGT